MCIALDGRKPMNNKAPTTTHATTPTTWRVTITKLGTPSSAEKEVTIPYNGVIFEFLPMDTVALCRRAASTEGGTLREGNMIARVWGE